MTPLLDTGSCHGKCTPVPKKVIDQLQVAAHTTSASEEVRIGVEKVKSGVGNTRAGKLATYVDKRARIASDILEQVFTTHVHSSAFEGVHFGANPHGIFKATVDDLMHSHDGGLVIYTAESVFEPFTDSQREKIETVGRERIMRRIRSSVKKDYPRIRYAPGYSNLTLQTNTEKAGQLLLLTMTLHEPEGSSLIKEVHDIQKRRYVQFPEAEQEKDDASKKTGTKNKKKGNEDHVDTQTAMKGKKKESRPKSGSKYLYTMVNGIPVCEETTNGDPSSAALKIDLCGPGAAFHFCRRIEKPIRLFFQAVRLSSSWNRCRRPS